MKLEVTNRSFRAIILSCLLILSQLIPPFMGMDINSFLLFSSITCFILFVGIGYINPAFMILIGGLTPIIGLFQNLYPSVLYALTIAIANGIMVSIASMFQKRSMLIGILIASIFRFVFCWVMVMRIMPLFTMSIHSNIISSMGTLFSWPQLVSSFLGGLLSLPILFWLQLKRERVTEQQIG